MQIDTRGALSRYISNGAYNRSALAKKAGLTPSKLSGILNKKRKMDSDEMFSICDALGVTPNEIFGFGDEQKSA